MSKHSYLKQAHLFSRPQMKTGARMLELLILTLVCTHVEATTTWGKIKLKFFMPRYLTKGF